MASYTSIPRLTGIERSRRLLLVLLFLVVTISVYASFPILYELARGLPPWTQMLAAATVWIVLCVEYARTILGVEVSDESIVIRTRTRKRTVSVSAIAELEPVRRKGKLVKVRLRDATTRPIGTVPIVAGSRRIEREEELLSELQTLARASGSSGPEIYSPA